MDTPSHTIHHIILVPSFFISHIHATLLINLLILLTPFITCFPFDHFYFIHSFLLFFLFIYLLYSLFSCKDTFTYSFTFHFIFTHSTYLQLRHFPPHTLTFTYSFIFHYMTHTDLYTSILYVHISTCTFSFISITPLAIHPLPIYISIYRIISIFLLVLRADTMRGGDFFFTLASGCPLPGDSVFPYAMWLDYTPCIQFWLC